MCAKSFDKRGLVLLCGSFSKTLSPGFRIGWTAPGRFRDAVERLKFAASAANVSATQLAVARFLETGGYEHHIRKLRKALADTTARMTQSVCDHFPAGTRVTRPAGGFVLWVELPRKIDTMQLLEYALKERITLAPGPIFSPTRRYKNFMRISCGYPHSDQIEDAMKTIGRLIGS